MMRKISQHGPSTLSVSLPAKWARKYKVEKGSTVHVMEKKGMLLLAPAEIKKSKETITYDVKGLSKSTVKSILGNSYKCGADEIILEIDDIQLVTDIRDWIKEILPGYEVFDASSTRCSLVSISEFDPEMFEQLFRKVFQTTKSMAQSMIDYVNEDRVDELPSLLYLEEMNNRVVHSCHRILNKNPQLIDMPIYHYLIAWELEKGCDVLKKIIKNEVVKKTETKDFIKEMKSIVAFIDEIEQAMYNFSLEVYNSLYTKVAATRNKNIEQQTVLESYVLDLREFIASLGGVVFSLVYTNHPDALGKK